MARATDVRSHPGTGSSRCAFGLTAVLFLGLAARTSDTARGQSNGPVDSPPWYRKVLVGMEVGPTGAQFGSDPSDVGYAARFDGQAIVKRCVAAGCEYVVIWARDGEYAYYDSKVMPKCPGLGPRDVLRETVREGHRHGLPVIACCIEY